MGTQLTLVRDGDTGEHMAKSKGLDFEEALPLAFVVSRVEDQLTRAGLTTKEKEVARLVLAGFTNQEIGAMLSNTEKTTKTHLGNLLRKFYVTNRAKLLAKVFGYHQPPQRTT